MKDIDNIIKKSLNEAAEQISPKDQMMLSVMSSISENKEEFKMKRFSVKKIVVVCAAVCALFTVGVIGAGKVAVTESYSYITDEMREYPEQKELDKVIDFKPYYPKTLGGYEFESAVPSSNTRKDEDGNKIADYTDIHFYYKTENGSLGLNVSQQPSYSDAKGETTEYNGIEMEYLSTVYKFVPPGYELTDEDKELMDKNELEVSYGSSEVECMNMQNISWTQDGLSYSVMDMGAEIDKDAFVDMAKQIIDKR